MSSFFLSEVQLITVLLLICDYCMRRRTRFISLKLCVGFSVFDFESFLLKFIFLFNKMHELCKIIEKLHTILLPDLIFKLQREVLKFNVVCVSWSSPKIDLVTNFLNLENQISENVSFSQY